MLLGHSWWPKVKCWPVTPLRSSEVTEVTNRFLQITWDWEELETWKWSQCVCLVNMLRLICNLGQVVILTWRQILTLTFQGHAIGETREVWAGFVKWQLSPCGQWLDLFFHSWYVEWPFAWKVCLISGIWDQLFCLEITFKKSCAFLKHQNTPGGTGYGSGGMGRCHVSYYILGFEYNTRRWGLPWAL